MTCIRLNHETASASAVTVRLAFSGSAAIPATPLLRRTSGHSDGITSGAAVFSIPAFGTLIRHASKPMNSVRSFTPKNTIAHLILGAEAK